MTGAERRTLLFYVKYRHATPTFGNVLAINVHLMLYWLAMNTIGLALIFYWPRWYTFLFMGAMFGAMLRDLRRMHSVTRQWPRQRELLDWEEIQRRLAPDATPTHAVR